MKRLFLLDPDIAYLNHGSFGACPIPVFDAYQRYQRQLEAEPVSFLQRRFPELMESARSGLARFLACDPNLLAFVRNATYGMNLVARSLPLKPGDTILSTSHEYGAVDRMWQALCSTTGARLVRAPIPLPAPSPDAIVSAVANLLDPSVRVLTFSHISSESALLFPADKLLDLARSAGAISVVDGAHAPGQIPLDLAALNPDFYVGNCHKWLLSPKGAAFVYASPEWAERAKPLSVSWGKWTAGSSALLAENEWQGTADISAFLAVPDALAFRDAHRWPEVIARCQSLLDSFTPPLLALTRQPDLYASPALRPSQMATFRLPDRDHSSLHQHLFDSHKIEIPIFSNPQGTFFRISLQAYNSEQDLTRLTTAHHPLHSEPAPPQQSALPRREAHATRRSQTAGTAQAVNQQSAILSPCFPPSPIFHLPSPPPTAAS